MEQTLSDINLGETITFTANEGIDITENNGTVTISAEEATSANKGVASFSTDNFLVTSGAVTIKDAGVSNDELANSSITFSDGTNSFSCKPWRNGYLFSRRRYCGR